MYSKLWLRNFRRDILGNTLMYGNEMDPREIGGEILALVEL
jgi:hypothetical protein